MVEKYIIYVPHSLDNPVLQSLYNRVNHHHILLEGVMINLSHWMSSGFFAEDGTDTGANVYYTDSDSDATLFRMAGAFVGFSHEGDAVVPMWARFGEWELIDD